MAFWVADHGRTVLVKRVLSARLLGARWSHGECARHSQLRRQQAFAELEQAVQGQECQAGARLHAAVRAVVCEDGIRSRCGFPCRTIRKCCSVWHTCRHRAQHTFHQLGRHSRGSSTAKFTFVTFQHALSSRVTIDGMQGQSDSGPGSTRTTRHSKETAITTGSTVCGGVPPPAASSRKHQHRQPSRQRTLAPRIIHRRVLYSTGGRLQAAITSCGVA